MIKILIGGSPCTHWSIAQSKNRETTAKGVGWELFRNYLIARDKFKPDFFLYENNKSAAQAIKDQIAEELGAPLQYINSALVSAQNRQRFYVHNFGNVPMPKDRGILLQDVLESGLSWVEKAYAYTTRCTGAIPEDTLSKRRHTMVAEPVIFNTPHGFNAGGIKYEKAPTLTDTGSYQHNNFVVEPCPLECLECEELDDDYFKGGFDGNLIGRIANKGQYKNGKQPSQQYRVYTSEGKAVCVDRDARKYYVCPITLGSTVADREKAECFRATYDKCGARNFEENIMRTKGYEGVPVFINQLENTEVPLFLEFPSGRKMPIYRVQGGHITIKGKEYDIKLPDGYYIIRKLTVTEACRLQTLPDDYCRAVSAAQAYKGLGNGWTAEVIIHLLSHALAGIPKDEEILVLSMYDGIGTGRYCFDKLGYHNIKYFAFEIDKYAMQIAASNYPDIMQCGDAFQVREEGWLLQNQTAEGVLYKVDPDARRRYDFAVAAREAVNA